MIEYLLVLAEHGFGEFDEQPAMGNAAVVLHRSRDGVQIVSSIVGHAARTEQQGVTGRSIATLYRNVSASSVCGMWLIAKGRLVRPLHHVDVALDGGEASEE